MGVLRGFDQFMNIVLDNSVELTKGGEENEIGMVVSAQWLECLFPVDLVKLSSMIPPGSGLNEGSRYLLKGSRRLMPG